MTLSEAQIDKFWQVPSLHLQLRTAQLEPQLPLWERSPAVFLRLFRPSGTPWRSARSFRKSPFPLGVSCRRL